MNLNFKKLTINMKLWYVYVYTILVPCPVHPLLSSVGNNVLFINVYYVPLFSCVGKTTNCRHTSTHTLPHSRLLSLSCKQKTCILYLH